MHKGFQWIDYVLLSVIFIYLFCITKILPLNYDESYNLQVPLMLLREQKYDTIYHTRSFDGFTTISTGPTVLLPTVLVFKFFGLGILPARITQLFYIMALLGLFWAQVVKQYNRIIGVALILVLYSVPTQLFLGLAVLGELPALFFLLLGISVWERGSDKFQNIAILIMGLAVITKLYFVLVLLPLLALLLIRALQTNKSMGSLVKESITATLLFLSPLVLWETIKFLSLGFSSYLSYLAELNDFMGSQKPYLSNSLAPNQFYTAYLDRFTVFSKGLFPGIPEWLMVILMGVVFVISTRKIIQGIKEENIVFALSFLIFVTYFLWFVFISSLGWWRNIYPFSILFLFLLGDTINSMLKTVKPSWAKQLGISVLSIAFVLYVIPFVINQHKFTQTFAYTLNSQREFAKEVKNYRDHGYKIGVHGWWQAPEISFLNGGMAFQQFNCAEPHQGKYAIIYTLIEEAGAPDQASALKKCLEQKVFESDDKAFSLYIPKK